VSKFEDAVKVAAEGAVLKIISDGAWIGPDYANRFKIPPEMMTEIWQMVDKDRLKQKMAARLEDELADRIMNHMAAEIATDVKQILSVKERREALRHIARENMDAILTAKGTTK
jgi:hypothetical protein